MAPTSASIEGGKIAGNGAGGWTNQSYAFANITATPTVVHDDALLLYSNTRIFSIARDRSITTLATFTSPVTSLAETGCGNLLVALSDGTLLRSVHGGAWRTTLKLRDGTWIWRVASNGTTVFAAEYGNFRGPYDRTGVWRSDDDGAAGTWRLVASSRIGSGTETEHFHIVAVDPYTGETVLANGDARDEIQLSKDGETFLPWGTAIQPTAVLFEPDRILWGDDPYARIWEYNRSTRSFAVAAEFSATRGAVYSLLKGENGVFYAGTTSETVNDTAAIYVSDDGHHWTIAKEFVSHSGRRGPETLVRWNGRIWFRNSDGGVAENMTELTRDEVASMLAHSRVFTAPSPPDRATAWPTPLTSDFAAGKWRLGADSSGVISNASWSATIVRLNSSSGGNASMIRPFALAKPVAAGSWDITSAILSSCPGAVWHCDDEIVLTLRSIDGATTSFHLPIYEWSQPAWTPYRWTVVSQKPIVDGSVAYSTVGNASLEIRDLDVFPPEQT